MRTPDRWIFAPAEQAALVSVYSALAAGRLGYSEWAVKTPFGGRIRRGWDPRFETHQPAAHQVEP